jgi:hypothetical protein
MKPPHLTALDLRDASEEHHHSYVGQSAHEIIQRETMHKLIAEKLRCDQTAQGPVFINDTNDQHLLSFIPTLTKLYANIVANDASPVEAIFVRWARRPGFRLTALGQQAFQACKFFGEMENEGRNWQQAYVDYQFHPVFAVMFRAIAKWWSPIRGWGNPKEAVLDCAQDRAHVEALCQFFGHVRKVCRTQAFLNLVKDHEHEENDNFRSACTYIKKQFEAHSHLLVVRIDLYFKDSHLGEGYADAADTAITKYQRALRMGRVIPGYLGCLAKRENGDSRGTHYHLMVLVDGHLGLGAYKVAQALGEKWMQRVGMDVGSFFNCYMGKDRHRFNGIGSVRFTEAEKLVGLRIALWYMTKQESVLKVEGSKVKNFWRGWKVKNGVHGEKLSKADVGVRLVKRLLGGVRSEYPPSLLRSKQLHDDAVTSHRLSQNPESRGYRI